MAEYPIPAGTTSFEDIYNAFLAKITDDMYSQDDPAGWTKEDTLNDLGAILLDAIPGFEFPRFPLYAYQTWEDMRIETGKSYVTGQYNCVLTPEEINIFALLMLNVWVQRQMTSIENTRMKYAGSDFKMTSQANHLAKLMDLKKETERQAHHMQRLYKRRKLVSSEGAIKSNWSTLMEKSVFDG